jgi:hypothetical protein
MENKELLIDSLKRQLQIEFAEKISFEEIKEKLSEHINYLINNKFQDLINLLYRIDINENKLRELLNAHKETDASNIIAGLIIERQLQKIKTRKEFSQKKNEGGDEEKW